MVLKPSHLLKRLFESHRILYLCVLPASYTYWTQGWIIGIFLSQFGFSSLTLVHLPFKPLKHCTNMWQHHDDTPLIGTICTICNFFVSHWHNMHNMQFFPSYCKPFQAEMKQSDFQLYFACLNFGIFKRLKIQTPQRFFNDLAGIQRKIKDLQNI